MSQASQLYRLQSLDSSIDKAQQELADIEAKLGESEPLKQARATHEAISQSLRQTQTAMKDLELEVKGLADKISGQEKLLYSGKTLSPKEAANLQDEITSLKKWHANREELLLETMVEVEEKEEDLSQAQAALESIEATWKSAQSQMIQRKAELEAQVAQLREQRPDVLVPITVANRDEYEALRRKKAGVAVSAARDGQCQACGIMVSPNKLRQVRSGADLVYCGTCGRILYAI